MALESLTQAERNLLYQIRTFARFRKQLYVEIASTNGGSINGASFQPSGVLSNGGGGSSGLSGTGIVPGVIVPPIASINVPLQPPGSPGTINPAAAITPAAGRLL